MTKRSRSSFWLQIISISVRDFMRLCDMYVNAWLTTFFKAVTNLILFVCRQLKPFWCAPILAQNNDIHTNTYKMYFNTHLKDNYILMIRHQTHSLNHIKYVYQNVRFLMVSIIERNRLSFCYNNYQNVSTAHCFIFI